MTHFPPRHQQWSFSSDSMYHSLHSPNPIYSGMTRYTPGSQNIAAPILLTRPTRHLREQSSIRNLLQTWRHLHWSQREMDDTHHRSRCRPHRPRTLVIHHAQWPGRTRYTVNIGLPHLPESRIQSRPTHLICPVMDHVTRSWQQTAWPAAGLHL
jgi:hypothetical protein